MLPDLPPYLLQIRIQSLQVRLHLIGRRNGGSLRVHIHEIRKSGTERKLPALIPQRIGNIHRRFYFQFQRLQTVLTHTLQHVHIRQSIHARPPAVHILPGHIPAGAAGRKFLVSVFLQKKIPLSEQNVIGRITPAAGVDFIRGAIFPRFDGMKHGKGLHAVFFRRFPYPFRIRLKTLDDLPRRHAYCAVERVHPPFCVAVQIVFADG